MELLKTIEFPEIIAIGIFLLFYAFFLFKNGRIARQLHAPFPGLIFLKFMLRGLLLATMIIALLSPSFGVRKSNVMTIAKDIFIAVDLSESMNARDVQPSRLDKVKFELKKIVDAFPSDRIGLIIFSNEAFMQCPLTYDKSALAMFIETLNTQLVPNAGTSFYEPLKMAMDKLLSEDETSKKTSKLILLISDGEDFSEQTPDIIRELEEQQIRLLTLGVGTAQGAKLPSNRGYKKDREGNEIVSKLSSKGLEKMAEETGGSYYEINAQLSQTEKLINDINTIKGELRESKLVDVENNKYWYFALAALVLLVLDILIQIPTFTL